MPQSKNKQQRDNPERQRRRNRARDLHEAIQLLGLDIKDVARGSGVFVAAVESLAFRGPHDNTLDSVSLYVERVARARIGRIGTRAVPTELSDSPLP